MLSAWRASIHQFAMSPRAPEVLSASSRLVGPRPPFPALPLSQSPEDLRVPPASRPGGSRAPPRRRARADSQVWAASARLRPGPTHQVHGHRQQQQEQPQVEVAAVGEPAVLGVVVPAPGERGPHALAEQLQHLGHHAGRAPGPRRPPR